MNKTLYKGAKYLAVSVTDLRFRCIDFADNWRKKLTNEQRNQRSVHKASRPKHLKL